MLSLEQIARVTHEANRAYCISIGDNSQPSWDDAPQWQQDSALAGVAFHIHNPFATADMSHKQWLEIKIKEGWKYGPIKDAEKKEHPCCVAYEDLPIEQKRKDYLFIAIVHALA